jgi:glycosyltransferase involved in cell wall biosynthesis
MTATAGINEGARAQARSLERRPSGQLETLRIVRYHPRALVGDGGMTNSIKKWSRGMVRAGAHVTVVCEEGVDPPTNDRLEWRPVRHRGPRLIRAATGLEASFEGADVIVLHSGWTYHNVRAAAAARQLGIPYFLEPRGAYDPSIVTRKPLVKKAWWLALEGPLVRGARAIHVFFEEERSHLTALDYPGEVIVASNGVDAPPKDLWDGGSGGYLLWLGRFDPEHKGLDILLHAMTLIPKRQRPRLRLHGPDWRGQKRRVDTMIRTLGLQTNVTVEAAAYGEAKRELLTQAAGFVYPSRWDACPNSVLEAISLGVPTLVTPYPLGAAFAARDGAVLAQLHPASLAEGIRKLVSPAAAEIGRHGAHITRTELSWDQMARTWLAQAQAVL